MHFQNEVAAAMAVHILAAAPIRMLGLTHTSIPTSIHLETSSPIDDVVLNTSDGGFCFVNVKRNVQLSSLPDSPLGAVTEQFVRQRLAMQPNAGTRPWERELDAERDRFILATAGPNINRLVEGATAVTGKIAHTNTYSAVTDIPDTAVQSDFLEAFASLARFHWKRHSGTTLSDGELIALLKVVRIIRVDANGDLLTSARALLRDSLEDPTHDELAWSALVTECAELAARRAGADQSGLLSALRARGVTLRSPANQTRDIDRLKAFTEQTLGSLTHLAHLPFPESESPQGLMMRRRATEAIVSAATEGSLLVVGEPGAGKSGALYAAAKELRDGGARTLVIAVDQHKVSTARELADDIGIASGLFEVLSAWTDDKPGVLIIDALDAARGGPSEAVFQRLVREVMTKLRTWNVVASIRVFDLRFGVAYRDLFIGKPPDKRFVHQEFPNLKHVHVLKLQQYELEQLWTASPTLRAAHERAGAQLQDLLTSPFNLFLFSNIVRVNSGVVDSVSTQIDLLDKYWSYRVIDHDWQSDEREEAVRTVVTEMVRLRTLAVDARVLANSPHRRDLFSRGILSPMRSRGEQILLFGFSHHMLFDYAVARLLLASGQSTTFTTVLTESDDVALLLAPGAILALRMLWQFDEHRHSFWERSLELASKASVGSFCRMLPTRVAADSTERVEEWRAILDALLMADASTRGSARFLVRHVIGTLTSESFPQSQLFGAAARPWCALMRHLSEIDTDLLRGAMRPFLHHAVDAKELTHEQANDVSKISVLTLRAVETEPAGNASVSLAIQGIARTFSSDPQVSADAIRRLLTPARVATHGYTDLFWLAGSIKDLFSQGTTSAETSAEIYHAAFCSPLPSPNEETNFGGRILALRSNQRQDFESARYQLVEAFTSFAAQFPVLATSVLIDALEYYAHDQRRVLDAATSSFPFRGKNARYTPDSSVYWGNYQKNDAIALREQFQAALANVARAERVEEIASVLDFVAERNTLAGVWALLLAVGAQVPIHLGVALSPLLCAEAVLDGIDTTKQAGDLIAAVFDRLDVTSRGHIEETILTCSEHAQRILLGCMPVDSLVSGAARDQRKNFEKQQALLPNTDPFNLDSEWVESDKDWWLTKEGVDLSLRGNDDLNASAERLTAALQSAKNSSTDESTEHLWHQVRSVVDTLSTGSANGEALIMKAWSSIADALDVIALECASPDDVAKYPTLIDLILRCVADDMWPLPIVDEEHDRRFEAGPSWSSPSPRVGGAQALVAVTRALGEIPPAIAAALRRLARDVRPEVRFQILGRLNMLFNADRELMFELIGEAFRGEANRSVLSGVLSMLSRVLSHRPSWVAHQLLDLRTRHPAQRDTVRDDFSRLWTQLMVRLCLSFDEESACGLLTSWSNEPISFKAEVSTALGAFRSAISLGEVERATEREDRIRRHASRFFLAVTQATLNRLDDLFAVAARSKHEEEQLESAVKILDALSTELYFGSGAFAENRRSDEPGGEKLSVAAGKRFIAEFGPVLEVLGRAPYPSITHHLLETLEAFIDADPEFCFRLSMGALNAGGNKSGYHFESLGMSLFNRLVRRYLADYRSLITSKPALRRELMSALDTFVETGWREARELVYELPEMLR